MTVAIVGRPATRARLRPLLEAAGLEVIAQVDSQAEAALLDPRPDLVVLETDLIGSEPEEVRGEPLTPREREVLEWLAEGLPNRLIAERLGISEHTVKFHVASIYGKLGVSTRAEAVRRGLRRGLIAI